MDNKVEIKVGDYIFNKDDVAKGLSTILFRVDEVTERELKRYNDKTGNWEVYGKDTLVDAYCLATGHGYGISIEHTKEGKDKWAVIPAETMKVLCA